MAHHSHMVNSLQREPNLPRRKTQIKLLQVNLQHSRVAASNLIQVILQYIIDIAFVQEPYTIHNNVAGFPKGFKIFANGGGTKSVAIIVNNNDVDVIAIIQGSHEDAILTEIRYKGLTSWSQSLSPHRQRHSKDLDTVENILQHAKGEGLILAIDSNARSKLWFDKHTNARGGIMVEFIITRDLLIINKETGIPSFETNRRRSWIDLTLSNSKLAQKARRWTCGEEESCADHKVFFDIESMDVEGNATHHLRKRYNTKIDNWGNFVYNLTQNLVTKFNTRTNPDNLTACEKALGQNVKLCSDTDEVIHKFTSATTAAYDASFQVLKPGRPSTKGRNVSWWTNELTILSKKALAMRRKFQRTKNDANLRQERRLQYIECNRTYQAKLREEKFNSWKDFCSSTRNSNPWNAAYRYAAGKIDASPTYQLSKPAKTPTTLTSKAQSTS